MSAEIINLRDAPTLAQVRLIAAWSEAELAAPTRNDDHSLCQDMARLVHQIDCAAFLAGAIRPSAKNVTARDELDLIFLKLYKGAEALMGKAMDEYPTTQGQGKKRRVRKRRQ